MTLSNKLTFCRLLMAPVFFILFWIEEAFLQNRLRLIMNVLLILLAAISETTDILDGKIARKSGKVTDFGKLFDPFADSVSRFTFFLCFWWAGLFPAWMVMVLFYRDAAISFLRLVLRGENVVLAARYSGKFKAVIQAIAIFIILLARVGKSLFPDFPLKSLSWWTMFVVVLVTVYSFIDYLRANKDILIQMEK